MTTAAPAPPPAADAAQVTVRFVTRLPAEYRVAEDPVTVPTSLARHGLSQVVNHLLATTTPVPFDFLVDGALVRGPLDDVLRARGTSAEAVITVEYLLAVAPPAPRPPAPADDWVTALCGGGEAGAVIAGCADGRVRAWGAAALAGGAPADAVAPARHPAGVDAVAWLAGGRFASAGRDGVVRVSAAPPCVAGGAAGAGVGAVLAEGRAAADSLACLAPAPDGDTVAAGGWDGVVRLWRVDADSVAAGGGGSAAAPKKRRAAADAADAASAPASLAPSASLEGHAQCVAAAAWPSAAALATGSWDGSVRWWAPDRGGGAGPPVDALHTGAAVFAVAASAATGPSVVAFGGAATGVKLWDSRAPAAGAASGAATLGTHADWVAALAAHPLSPHTLASASHDGSVRLWDARGRGVPLASLAAHDGKALAVAWAAPGVVVSGGADGRVRSWAVKV